MKKLIKPLLILVVVAFAVLGINNVVTTNNKIELRQVELKSTTSELKQLQLKYDNLNFELDNTDAKNSEKIKQLEAEKLKLEQEKLELEQQVSAKKEANRIAAEKVNDAAGLSEVAYATSNDIDCNNQVTAKAFIYCHESGNNPGAINSGGCRGLGQACPGSKLPCGNDYACQDQWFTSYMLQRYGTWEKAQAFWLARVPINGKDVGNWW